MRNIVILNSLHFSYPLPILMRVSYNTLIVKQNTSDYYKYTEIQKSLSDAQTVIAGKDASIRNLQTDLAAATARLSAYEQKEKDEQASRIETLVENAIAEGKIDREAKTQWVEMAGSNFELAESTLASIPAREKISKEIADDPANIQATAEATKTAEQLMAEKVAEVVGADFKFRKL